MLRRKYSLQTQKQHSDRGVQIAVFEGSSVGKAYQVVDAAVGSGKGEFALVEDLCTDATAEVPNNTIAIYPFSKSLTVEPASNGYFYINAFNINGVTFPSRQIYIPGSFCDKAFPMVAVTQKGGRSLAFKNIGGVIKLSLTGTNAISEITLEGHNNEYLSGPVKFSLTPPDDEFNKDASIYMISKGTSKSVTIVCDPAVQLDSEKATDFFFSIPPTEFKAGFTVTITDSDGNKSTKSTNKANNVRRSTILAMPEIDNDRDKEIQKFESPYGYDVIKFVKGIGKDIEFPEDVQLIMDWLKDQEFVVSVECDEYYKVIHIKFKDSTDFYIVNEQEEHILQIRPAAYYGDIIIGGLSYNIESQPNEVIQDNNRMLYVRADAENPIFYEDGISSKYTPADIEIVTTDGFNYFEEDLSAYGSILISHTHGVPQGHFCISDSSIPDNKAITGIIRDVDEKTFHPTYLTDNKDIYSRIGNNNPFVFANYCWSAKGAKEYVSTGSFVGYDILSNIKENADKSKSYFSGIDGLFKGLTHLEAFNQLSAMDFPAWTVPETGEARDWTPYVHTTPQQYGEPNMRYYSITTEEPDTKDGKAIIKGKINGYKNLRDDVKYKVFLYDGTMSAFPQFPETAIDLTVSDDGTIHQDISEHLEPDIEYSFNIGIEYYDNYYIGDNKKIKKEEVTYTISEIAEDVVNINEYVSPIFSESENIEQLAGHLESIQRMEGVKDAWTTSTSLFILTKAGLTLSWTYTLQESYEDSPETQTAQQSVMQSIARSTATRAISYEEHNSSHDYQNVCIINQQFNDESRKGYTTIYDKLANDFENNGFGKVKRIDGGEADLAFFEKSLTNYDIIFLITHGAYDDRGNHWIATGEEARYSTNEEFAQLLIKWCNEHGENAFEDGKIKSSYSFGWIIDNIIEVRNNNSTVVQYIGISEEYIKERIEGRFDNAIIFNTACESLTSSNSLVSAFQNKGAAVYLGYDNINDIGKKAGPEFFNNMINGMTIEESFNALEEKYRINEGTDRATNQKYKAFLEYLPEANKDICIAHLTPETRDTTMVNGNVRLNGTFKTPIKGYHIGCNLGFCYSDSNSEPTIENSETVFVENGNDPVTAGTVYCADLSDIKFNTKYYYRFFFQNPHSKEYVYGDTKSFELEMDQWVDLGLSVLWAAWNVGANSPEEYGGYYAWGETEEKSSYTIENYKYYRKYYVDGELFIEGINIGSQISGTNYDVAHVKWGNGARMPSKGEVLELLKCCSNRVAYQNGIQGYNITGPNGNNIFLPCAGWYENDYFHHVNQGYYWTGYYYEDSSKGAFGLYFCEEEEGMIIDYDEGTTRHYGLSIRPVKDK
mgnify:CR=1 FL=1